MTGFLKKFHRAEDGAVTVDWVVLTAAMAGFGFAVASIIVSSANDPANGMGTALANIEVGS